MLRIAFIVHKFQMGGLERCVARLASHLDRSRFIPIIICMESSGSAVTWLEKDDVPVFELNKRPGNDPGVIARLARLLRRQRIHIVHSHNWGSLIETVLARLLGSVPYHVHAERGLELEEIQTGSLRKLGRKLVSRVGFASVDNVVAVSREIHDRLRLCRIPAHRIQIIYNGIEPLYVADSVYERKRIRHTLGLDGRAVIACTVSRLTPIKNLCAAIDSVNMLARTGKEIHFVIVGDGPERYTLGMRAHSAGIANLIHIVGEQSDVGAWLSAADIYVNTSISEGMSQSILEAMAAGLPLVVTDVGENATLVGRKSPCGRVVPSGDVQAIALALGELSQSKELRGSLGEIARERQRENFSEDRMVRRYENLYCRLVGAKKPTLAAYAFWRN